MSDYQSLRKYVTSEAQRIALEAVITHGSNIKAALALGKSRRNVDKIIVRLKSRAENDKGRDDALIFPQMPKEGVTVEDILSHKRKIFKAKKEIVNFNKLINVEIKDNKPIAICLMGDPHVDDDGCDIETLESDVNIIKSTEGMYAGQLGDLLNNWVGRLARLYANQSTTAAQGIMLMEWLLNSCPHLFVINGNHDMWNQGADIISFIMRSVSGINQSHGARIALNFPNGRQVRIRARHTFKGHSMYHANQGGIKAQHFAGELDHVYVEGHKHVDGAVLKAHPNNKIAWAFIVSGYKSIDDFADENNFVEARINASLTIVINPHAVNEAELIKPFWDAKSGADYLTYLRGKYD